jgi:hypothetical protein
LATVRYCRASSSSESVDSLPLSWLLPVVSMSLPDKYLEPLAEPEASKGGNPEDRF